MEDISSVKDKIPGIDNYSDELSDSRDADKAGYITLYITFLLGSDLLGIPVNSVR